MSAQITAFHDVQITNRLTLQPRIDLKLRAQRVPDSDLGSGFTDVELGALLRYEITRNFVPYIGVNWERKLGETASIASAKGDPIDNLFLVGGVRVLGKRRIPATALRERGTPVFPRPVIGPAATCGGA